MSFQVGKLGVFSYFAYVTEKKKESKMSEHKKTRGQTASRFL